MCLLRDTDKNTAALVTRYSGLNAVGRLNTLIYNDEDRLMESSDGVVHSSENPHR